MNLTNEFQSIREWAKERGLYEKGNPTTQFTKLIEEAGELAQAILKEKPLAQIDAIGDCVVVLVNLSHILGLNFEDCVNSAYLEIKNRKGSMQNGTFVKHGEGSEGTQENY